MVKCNSPAVVSGIVALARQIMAGRKLDAFFYRAFECYIDKITGQYDDDLLEELSRWGQGENYNDFLLRIYAEMALETASEVLYGENVFTPFEMSSIVDGVLKRSLLSK